MERKLECDSFICGAGTDEEVAERQLGRKPEGMIRASAKCSYGVPAALLCSPVIIRACKKRSGTAGAEPFPTIYWLSCPYLREKAGWLEAGEHFHRMRSKVSEDSAFEEKLRNASIAYKAERRRLFEELPEETKGAIGSKAADNLLEAGPGGVRDHRNIKCLHIHLANYISGMDDPLGEQVARIIADLCDD